MKTDCEKLMMYVVNLRVTTKNIKQRDVINKSILKIKYWKIIKLKEGKKWENKSKDHMRQKEYKRQKTNHKNI